MAASLSWLRNWLWAGPVAMLKPPSVLLWVLLACSDAQLELGYNEGDICKQEGGVLWTCTRPEKCPKAKDDFVNRSIRPVVCRKQGGIPIICCEPQSKPAASSVGSKSMQMCKKYAESVYIPVGEGFGGKVTKYDSCAASEPLISQGRDAKPKEFPHMALIGVGEKTRITWVCGGSLISERFVMSAGHCSDNPGRPPRWVRLGDYNTQTSQDDVDGSAQTAEYEIAETIVHPQYVSSSVYYDIALYRLKEDVEINEFVRPACLQTQHYFSKTYALATGWGKTGTIEKRSAVLQKVNLTLTSRKECSDVYESVKDHPKQKGGIKDDLQICAGDLKTGKDTCNGDSGGPLQLRLAEPYCMYSVIGIVSFGPKDCGDGSRPGVYTRVSHYVPWIEGIVWP